MKKKMLTGFRPTGRLHLGHLHGNIGNMVKYQAEYENFFFLVDWHALSTEYQNPKKIKSNLIDCVIDLISLGIDPELTYIYRQSDISEISELTLYFSMITPISWLERCPTYKEQLKIPVGEDQLPHLEITREIARRFNNLYGKFFTEPKEMLSKDTRVPGIDGRKMSKSYGNAIFLSDGFNAIKKKVKKMITDPQRIHPNDPGHPDICNVFNFYQLYLEKRINKIEERCRAGEIGCTLCKDELADIIYNYLEKFRSRRKELEGDIDYIYKILEDGKNSVREISTKTIEFVRKKMGID